jgi:hypothetical protein
VEWCASIGVDPVTAGIHRADTYSRLMLEVADPHRADIRPRSSCARY